MMPDLIPSYARQWRLFGTRQALAEALALETGEALAKRILTNGRAALAVSGGSTPRLFLEQLSQAHLDWSKVDVTLVDERWVDARSDRSNEKMVRELLLHNKAQDARFISMKTAATDPEAAVEEVEARLRAIALPFAAVILGMGEDGHTASFFPGGDCLSEALDPANPHLVTAMRAPGAGEPRLTLTFPVLQSADVLALHIEGETKRQVFTNAEQDGPAEEMPIRAFLRAQRSLTVYWAA